MGESSCVKRLKVVSEEWLLFWLKEEGPLPREQLGRIFSVGAAIHFHGIHGPINIVSMGVGKFSED
jgi:uncharacterized protein (DUF3820 family)